MGERQLGGGGMPVDRGGFVGLLNVLAQVGREP